MDNNTYNLVLQLAQEQKSLWRIKKEYIKDASKSADVKKFWTMLAKDKENHVKELKELIKKHLK